MRNKILLGIVCLTASCYLAIHPQVKLPAANDSLDAQTLFVPQAGRLLYRYSVVPGGVRSAEEVALQRKIDKVVASHYSGIQGDRVTASTLPRPRKLYVSYRRNDGIYWTRRPVTLPAGERVLSDGAHLIRVRCGNRLSATPMLPVAAMEPHAGALDELVAPEIVGVPAGLLPIETIRTAGFFPPITGVPVGTSGLLLIPEGIPAVPTPGTSTQPTPPGVTGPGAIPGSPTGVMPQAPVDPGTPTSFPPRKVETPPTMTTEFEVMPVGTTPIIPPPTQPVTPGIPAFPVLPEREIPTAPDGLPTSPGVPTTPIQPEMPATPGNLIPETPAVPVMPVGDTPILPEQPTTPLRLEELPKVLVPSEQPNRPTLPEAPTGLPDMPVTPVPEPSTYVLVGLGLVAMAGWRR